MPFRGAYVALLTPLRADGSLAADAVTGHVERLINLGVDGLVVCGTTGEFADLTAVERGLVVQAAADAAAGRARIVAGVGAVGTTEACEHARIAADSGAEAVLALPPLYWKLGEDGLLRHFEQICAATRLPVLLYDYPSLSGTPLTPSLVGRVAGQLDPVVGIKLSGPELRVAQSILAEVKPHRADFSVLIGAGELVLAGMLAGADGAILAIANIDPEPLVALVAAVARGDLEGARRAQERLASLLPLARRGVPGILALKTAAQAAGSPIEPVVRTAPDDADGIIAAVRERAAGLLPR